LDNDGDGLIDLSDPGCSGASDNSETNYTSAPPPPPPPPSPSTCADSVDYIDSTYGYRVRQLATADAHEHNIYYPRNVWNADNSLMVGVHSDLEQKNWRIVLYNGAGC